jgi:hypothetical protein
MDDVKVTCPTCRGAREMMKLGGIMGKCNLCLGDGQVNFSQVPVPQEIVPAEDIGELVARVGEAIPWTTELLEAKQPVTAVEVQKPEPIEATLRVEKKKAIYKRKTG